MLAAYTDSLGVKYLAVLVFIMSPKAMSSFTVSIWLVCDMCVYICAFVQHVRHQPRSYAKLPISEAQSIKTTLTTPLRKKKQNIQSQKHSHTQHTHILYTCTTPPSLLLSGNCNNLRHNPFSDQGHRREITHECIHMDKQTSTFFPFCLAGLQTSLPSTRVDFNRVYLQLTDKTHSHYCPFCVFRLSILFLKRTDAGLYQCLVRNRMGAVINRRTEVQVACEYKHTHTHTLAQSAHVIIIAQELFLMNNDVYEETWTAGNFAHTNKLLLC